MALNVSTCIVGGIEPIQLPITNNGISVNSAAASKGISYSIGADSQLFSVMPYFGENNTCLTLVNICGTKSNDSCVAKYGGVYAPPSDVLATADQANWNGTFESRFQQGDADGSTELYFNDVMRIGGYDIPGLPIYTYTDLETDGECAFSCAELL